MNPRENPVRVACSIAERWNANGITYAVAHGLEKYPTSLGRDLDVLVKPSHSRSAISIASEVLKDHGMRVAHPPPIWGPRVVGIDPKNPRSHPIEIHNVVRLSWRSVTLCDRPGTIHFLGPFKVDPWASFSKRILLPFLANDYARFAKRPDEFCFLNGEHDVVADQLVSLCGATLAQSVCSAVANRDLQQFERVVPKLRSATLMRSFVSNPVKSLVSGFRSLERKVKQPFAPCGPIVALVGPDGAGKTTVADYLKSQKSSIFLQTVVRHWRPGVLPPLSLRGENTKAVLPRRHAGRFGWLRASYYAADFFLGRFLKDNVDSARQRLVLYDRCALDMAVDPLRYGLVPTQSLAVVWRRVPKPDLIVLLYDDPAAINSRKREQDVDEVRRQYDVWLRLFDQGLVDNVIRVNRPVEIVAEEIFALILESFLSKNKGGPVDSVSRLAIARAQKIAGART